MENSLKGLILAAGTIITCLVISLGFFIAKEAKTSAMNGAGQINNLNSEFVQSDKIIYDGAQITGSEVINTIHKFSNQNIAITVQTNKSTNNYNYYIDAKYGDIVECNTYQVCDEFVLEYINPVGKFEGSVIRDVNSVIVGLKFVQI